jgi:uncharacterized protein YjbI with pentapeptide repeats
MNAAACGSFFGQANLSGAYLSNTELWEANLREANLAGVNFRGADLLDAELWGANLTGTDFRDTKLDSCHFGANPGITDRERTSMIERGAIFEDRPLDRD